MDPVAPSASPDPGSPRIDLVEASWVLRFSVRTLGLRPWQIALAAFGGYYLLPLFLSAAWGTFLDEASIAAQLAPLGLGNAAGWLARSPGLLQPYGQDFVHFAMATVSMLFGAWIGVSAVTGFGGVFSSFVTNGQLLAPSELIAREAERANRLLRSLAVRGFLLFASLVLAAFMAARTLDPQYIGWWGHTSHGPAGMIFAVFVWAMIFFGGLYVYFLAVGLNALSRIFRHPVRLRPFHPDECNGFGAFGNYLLTLLLLSVLIAAALWITFWGGYLGVEKFVITWIGGLLAMVAIPVMTLGPLVRLTKQIADARRASLGRVELLLHERLQEVETDVAAGCDYEDMSRDIEHLVTMRRAMSELYPGNIFPFRPPIAGTLSIAYGVQVVVFINRALGTFL